MKAYEILRDIHHLGSRISGTVISRDEPLMWHGIPSGHLTIETETAYPALLPYSCLVDQLSSFSSDIIPTIGTQIDAVISNFVDGMLYLSAKPGDLNDSTIAKWKQYYDYIASLTVGTTITGFVERAMPFGLFVNIDSPFPGLIDIGHTPIYSGVQLPYDVYDWPAVGNQIQCRIGYFRFHERQIGLEWVPVKGA